MALITNDTQTQQTLFAAGIAQQVGQEAKRREAFFNALMDAVWASGQTEIQLPDGTRQRFKTGLSVEEKLAALGTKAGPLFATAAADRQTIVAADPTAADRLKPTPPEYASRLTFNPDGTVTVNPAQA